MRRDAGCSVTIYFAVSLSTDAVPTRCRLVFSQEVVVESGIPRNKDCWHNVTGTMRMVTGLELAARFKKENKKTGLKIPTTF